MDNETKPVIMEESESKQQEEAEPDVLPQQQQAPESFPDQRMALSMPSSSLKLQSTMLSTLQDLVIRNVVEDCVAEMLLDVETVDHLKKDLRVKTAEDKAAYMQLQQETTVEETRAMLDEERQHQMSLADDFVKELWQFNRELETLVLWKNENEQKVQDYDGLAERLEGTKQELAKATEMANRVLDEAGSTPATATQPSANSPTASTVAATATTNAIAAIAAVTSPIKTGATPTVTPTATITSISPVENDAPDIEKTASALSDTAEQPVTLESMGSAGSETVALESTAQEAELSPEVGAADEVSADKPTDGEIPVSDPQDEKLPASPSADVNVEEAEQDKKPAAVPETETADVVQEKEAAVTLEVDDTPDKNANLGEVDVEILMRIFGFMDPIDILNTAQITLSMYTKVDALFGIGEDGHTAPGTTPQVAEPAPTAPKPAPVAKPEPRKPPPTTSAAAVSQAKPKVVPPEASSASTFGNGLFSMLQPRGLAAPVVSTPTPTAGTVVGRPVAKNQPLNASVAQSMAAKLSDTELAAIISMTDKLAKMEKQLIFVTNDKEELQAKLSGTEAVKQFLIGKVRDAESKLQKNQESEMKVTHQIASDQEVIAFLDSRVQELEGTMISTIEEKSGTEAGFASLKESSSRKITVLTDMLKYEQEKLREQEADWKATKKVLVKEVKSCRAQIVALQAERDGYKEQNDRLKRAITSSGKDGGRQRR